jgi:hypothetical protein
MAHIGPKPSLEGRTRAQLRVALDRALAISYDDYRAQVVAFLEPEHQGHLGSRASWDDMQTAVVEFIERLARS